MITFYAYGYENILSTHKTTLEFTKDSELSLRGDCIVGVKAEFDFLEVKKFIENNKKTKKIIKIMVKLKTKSHEDIITAELNPDFNSETEMVIRKTDYLSDRTFAINADKAAVDIDRRIIETLKKVSEKIEITIDKQ